MLKVGLTGGIGCGKTTVTNLFSALDVPVIDADLISRQLVTQGQPALEEIAHHFGKSILHVDGSLNRTLLRKMIFENTHQKNMLEAILHPRIYQTINEQVALFESSYCIICVPLLFETSMQHWVDRILVVDCSEEIQLERVLKRDHCKQDQVLAIIASQVPRVFRQTYADDVIDNSMPLDYNSKGLAEQVKKLHNSYLSLSTTT